MRFTYIKKLLHNKKDFLFVLVVLNHDQLIVLLLMLDHDQLIVLLLMLEHDQLIVLLLMLMTLKKDHLFRMNYSNIHFFFNN